MTTNDSQSALGTKIEETRLLPVNGQAANQFFCGEMNINNDLPRKQQLQAIDESSTVYHQQAVTPSIMSSHSNKRQSHHLQGYNPTLIQQQISNNQVTTLIANDGQQPAQMAHNFFSRRTVSQKDSNGQIGFKMPLNSSSTTSNQIQQHVFTNQQQE